MEGNVLEAESKTKEQELEKKTIDYEIVESNNLTASETKSSSDQINDELQTITDPENESKEKETKTVFQNPLNQLQSTSTIEAVCKKSDSPSEDLLAKTAQEMAQKNSRRKKRIQSASLACGLADNIKDNAAGGPITSIFSVSGAQSRKIYHRQPISANNIFPSAKDDVVGVKEDEPPFDKASVHLKIEPNQESKAKMSEIMASGGRRPTSAFRNPLTGLGVSSSDENKCKGVHKRADGNPLLGTGYVDDRPASRNQRVPPGGYAHKLW